MIVKLAHEGGHHYLEAEEVKTWVSNFGNYKLRIVRVIYPDKKSQTDTAKTLFIGRRDKSLYKGTPYENEIVHEQGWVINKEGKTVDTLNQP